MSFCTAVAMQGKTASESWRPMQWMSHSPPQPPTPHTNTPCFPSTDSMGPHTRKHMQLSIYMYLRGHTLAQNTQRAPGGFLPILSVVAC